MRLVCPNCASQYEVDEALFPEEGREVQCSSCEEVWVQYPVEEKKPILLDPLARIDPAAAPEPRRPSDRLDAEERGALAAAVREEVAALERATASPSPVAPPVQAQAPKPDTSPPDEEDILAALRKQIELEGGDFGKGGEAKRQKPKLHAAAEAVGIDVHADDSAEIERRRKWNLDHPGEREERPARQGASPKPQAKKKQKEREAQVAREVRRYETAPTVERRPARLRRGFALGVLVMLIGAGVYLYRADVAEAYPPAAPYLDQYAARVDEWRRTAETLYLEYAPQVMERIAAFTGG